jgi:hypothetical protein
MASDRSVGEQHREDPTRVPAHPAGPESGGGAWLDRPGIRALAAGVFTYIIVAASVQVLEHLGYGDFGVLTLLGLVVAFIAASLAYYGGTAAARAVRLAGILAVLAFVAAVAVRALPLSLPPEGTIAWGLEASDCVVQDPQDVFVVGDEVFETANLSRPVMAGEVITTRDTVAGIELPPLRETAESEFDYSCTSESFRLRLPGTYAVEISVGDEILASGRWEVVEAGQ